MARLLSIGIQIEGLAELQRKLRTLGKQAAGRVQRTMITKGNRIVLQQAKAAAPRGPTAALSKSLTQKVKSYQSGYVLGVVGVKKNALTTVAGRRINPAKYLHLVLGGCKALKPTKKKVLAGFMKGFVGKRQDKKGGGVVQIIGRKARAVTGRDFLRRAAASAASAAVATMVSAATEGMQREIARLGSA